MEEQLEYLDQHMPILHESSWTDIHLPFLFDFKHWTGFWHTGKFLLTIVVPVAIIYFIYKKINDFLGCFRSKLNSMTFIDKNEQKKRRKKREKAIKRHMKKREKKESEEEVSMSEFEAIN